eukprot:s1164_g4.t1
MFSVSKLFKASCHRQVVGAADRPYLALEFAISLACLCHFFALNEDNNQITIEGNTAWAISEDIPTRFIAYGWNVLRVGDANDVEALTRAFLAFRREQERPTLIVVDSHIAWGAPTKQDSFHAHGTPLGEKEVAATKHIYNWPNEKFLVPNEVKEHLRQQMAQRGGHNCQQWEKMLEEYKTQYPEEGPTVCSLQGLLA